MSSTNNLDRNTTHLKRDLWNLHDTITSMIDKYVGYDDVTPELLNLEMKEAIKVRFKKSLCEDDYIEPGMIGYLTGVEYYYSEGKPIHYTLYFDMTDFMDHNRKYLREVYYPNKHTQSLKVKHLYTAEEAGRYENKITVYYGCLDSMTHEQHQQEINDYIEVVK